LNLKGKKLLVGVTGSISAYKAAFLVRLLVKEGAEVQVLMTESAIAFITPLTLATLSRRPVITSFTNGPDGTWNNHVDLGLWADAMVIAPATARTLSKLATGLSDDILTAVYLSARCPVFFAPAMDVDMYQHPSTRKNIDILKSYGNILIDSGYGELASGLIGEGRLAEPGYIVDILKKHFAAESIAAGKKVLITAGPTVEPIDPVRFISNRSSGKMGYALAKAFALSGADVTLISGPTDLSIPDQSISLVPVETAHEMFLAAQEHFALNHLIIFSAAVADYSPEYVEIQKIKKQGEHMTLNLKKTTDIAGSLSKQKTKEQITVGFALETEHEMEYAADKLQRKNLDYIIVNSLNDEGAGFAHDTNKISVIDRDKKITHFTLKSKDQVAQDILGIILDKWREV
jgi:phosphopantothenoylcysteine decarboxylase/phosphopantothenate--cysteine ligase